MRRSPLALALAAALAAGCTAVPPGECAATADCEAGLTCQGGVCVGCASDASCGGWQVCSATRRCVSKPGACGGDAECAAWEACGADHACQVRPGQCGGAGDCGNWETCTDHRCAPLPGYCSAQADCPWYQACRADHVCGRPTFDPAAVALWGTLDAAACGRRAVAPALHPDQARIGFDCAAAGAPAMVDGQGELLYTATAAGRRGVGRFEPDEAAWSGAWVLPADPLANDAVLVPPEACAGAGLDHWLALPGAGGLVYACAAPGGFDYLGADGLLRWSGPRVLAWTAAGVKLTRAAAGFQVVDAAGASAAVAGLGPSVEVLAARTRGEAFWVVDGAGFGAPRRYAVSGAGLAAFEGAYADPPAGVALDAPSADTAVLDGDGALWQRGADAAGPVVVRRPLAPAAAAVAYREADAPPGANDLTRQALAPFVLLQGGPLVTGP